MITNPTPLHPGKVLSEIYKTEMSLSQTALATLCGCSPRKINEIVNGKRGIPHHSLLCLSLRLGRRRKCGCECKLNMICGRRDRRPPRTDRQVNVSTAVNKSSMLRLYYLQQLLRGD